MPYFIIYLFTVPQRHVAAYFYLFTCNEKRPVILTWSQAMSAETRT